MVMDKSAIREARDSAVNLKFHLDENDKIKSLFPRENGLFVVTMNKVLRLRSPDDLDPSLDEPNAPWEQSIFLTTGSCDPLVARTILQTDKIAEIFFGKQSQEYKALMDISWEVLSSLISMSYIRERLERRISEVIAIVQKDPEGFTKGKSPKSLPIVEYYEIEFRSFVNEMRSVLSKISELFEVLTGANINSGHFHKAIEWAKENKGENGLLTKMLIGDQSWIKLWIDVRNAIEHPSKDKYIETLNFSLQKNRDVRLPTWRFIHPEYSDMARPQNLLEVFSTAINHVLSFFENLQIVLLDDHCPNTFKVGYTEIPVDERDKDAPLRYSFQLLPPEIKS